MNQYGIASYRSQSGLRAALVFNGRLVDLSKATEAAGGEAPAGAGDGLDGMVRNWAAAGGRLDEIAERTAPMLVDGTVEALPQSTVLAAPLNPGRMFCAASNYVEHAEEMGTVLAAKVNSNPFIFMKAPSCVVGEGESVVKPARCEMLDWEVELGVVIGTRCRDLSPEQALDVIAGYTIVNDVTARDLNVRDDYPFKFDWFQGKSWDTFGPMGPWMVPSSCFGDPNHVGLRLSVNGEIMQDGNTDKLIFNVVEQLVYLSSMVTLLPGDVIATGTPDGVGMGRGVFLKPGDVMVASIDGIGSLTNPVVAAA